MSQLLKKPQAAIKRPRLSSRSRGRAACGGRIQKLNRDFHRDAGALSVNTLELDFSAY